MREERGLSLHALSALAAVERKVLRGLEAGTANVSLKTLDRIAQALQTTVAGLFDPTAGASSLFDTQTLLALNIKRLRHERSWKTTEVESRSSMKAVYVAFIETGKKGCTLQTLLRLATAFEVEVPALLKAPASKAQHISEGHPAPLPGPKP